MQRKNSNPARYLARAGIIAALYVVLTAISALVGAASGAVQFRISEMLCILPVFMPEAIPGLSVGCLIANLTAGGVAPLDLIFGTLATFIGAVGAYILRKLPPRFIWVATLPNIIANTLILPPVIIYSYGASEGYWLIALSIFISQAISAGLLGSFFYPVVKETGLYKLF